MFGKKHSKDYKQGYDNGIGVGYSYGYEVGKVDATNRFLSLYSKPGFLTMETQQTLKDVEKFLTGNK